MANSVLVSVFNTATIHLVGAMGTQRVAQHSAYCGPVARHVRARMAPRVFASQPGLRPRRSRFHRHASRSLPAAFARLNYWAYERKARMCATGITAPFTMPRGKGTLKPRERRALM